MKFVFDWQSKTSTIAGLESEQAEIVNLYFQTQFFN